MRRGWWIPVVVGIVLVGFSYIAERPCGAFGASIYGELNVMAVCR